VITAISDGMVALLKEFYGRGPTRTKSYCEGEGLALALAGEADPGAGVAGLALELAQLALGDRRRAIAVVLVLGEQVPGEDGELADRLMADAASATSDPA
jgi:hypothetical protein